MPSFDINTYLNNRLSNRLTNEKMQGLGLAASQKQAELAAQKQEREARLAAEQKAYEDSWVGKLGLEPQGFVANRVNDAASLVSGASRLIGNVAALPNSVSSLIDNTKLDQGDIEAFNRYQTNALQAGDMARLALPKEAGASAVFDTIKSSQKNREAARSINNTFDLTRTVEQTNRNQFIGSLKEGFDQPYSQLTDGIQQAKDGNLLDAAGNVSAGVAKLLFNAGSAMVTNGSGVREYVLENAPQLLIGTAGVPGKVAMAASNIGYAIDNYQQGIENFAKANNGQMPSAARLQEMALQAASLAVAEQAGDMIGLGLGKLAGRAGRSGILNTVKAGAGGAASESLTEGYQTYMEGQITGKPVTASDVYVGGAIGAAAGGVLTGSMRGLQELSGTTPEKIEERKVEGSRQEALTGAIASGNVSALVDPKSSTYAPDQAIAALFGISQRADATPESKQAGLEQASKIVSDLEAQRDSVQDELDNTSPDRLQAKLDANRDSWPAELVAMVEEEIATLKANPADPKAVAALQKKAAKLDALISESQDVLKVFTQESQDKNIDVAAEAAKITAADPVESQSAASRIINLSMASPDSLDTGLASSLAADASNGLTDSQRTYLRTFSEARAAENQLKRMGKVSEEIYAGSSKGAKGTRYVGLVNYRSSLATALLARNQAYADRQLELLTKFEASHQGKAQAASDALAAFQNDGINRRIEKDSSGNWRIQEGLWADNKKRVLNGGLNINANATQLVAAVKVEAAAISKTAAELQAAYEVGFSKGTTSGANNVQNVSQAPEGSETASAELQVEAAPQAGTVEGSAGATGGVTAPAATDAATGASPVAPAGTVAVSESKVSGYAPRTKRNVDAGNITIAFAVDHSTAGEKLTARLAKEAGKPFVKWTSGMKLSEFADQIIAALKATNGTSINVAGNGIYSWGNTSQAELNEKLFKVLGKVKTEYPALATIVSGGQTGADMAGVIAGKALGLNVDVHLPAGFVQRGANRQDYKNTQAGIEKQIADGAAALTKPVTKQSATQTVKSASVDKVEEAFFADREDSQDGTKNVELSLDYGFKVTPENILGLATKMFQIGEKNRAAGFATNFWGNYQRFIESYRSMVVLDVINDQYKGDRGDFRAKDVEKELASLLAKTKTVSAPAAAATQEAPASAVSTVDTVGAQAQLQSTEQSTATSEEVVPVSEEVATQEAVQPAEVVEPTSSSTPVVERSEGLLALQAKSPEGTPHDEKRLGDFFTQSAGKDTDGSKRPLAAVKDFMSALAAGTVKLAQYVKDQDLSEGAKPQVWAKFVEKAAQWAPEITRNLKVGIDQKFHYLDPIRFLQTLSVDKKTTAEVEENVKTAISAAIFSYAADQAGRAALNDDKAINGILGRSKDSPVSANAREALQSVGVYQSQVIDSLGSAVMDALGLKLNPNAPQDMLAKMQVSLGGHALKLMEDQGLLVRTALSNGEINRLRTENLFEDSESGNQTNETASVTDNVKGHIFFTLARDRAGQPTGTAKEIADAIKGSQSLIQNLFGIESSLTFPSLTPPKGLQKESDTGMGLPGFIKKVFKLNQTRPWKANKDPLKILSFFSEEEGIEMAGVDNATEHTHRRNLNSKRAKNDGLIREFRNFMQFVGDLAVSDKGMEQEFYLSQEMWKQQRSGYKSNAVNPNTSKIVRWLMAPDSWSTDINLNDEKQLQSFMLRVSEGFGIKPEKDASEEAVKDLESKMKEPAMQQAVKAMQAMLFVQNADATDQQRSAVLKAVKAGKQNLHTLASLIAYARYQQAVDTKADTFTTNLMGEVDGVSNGSVLNSIMYGAAATAEQLNTLLEKGGIYTLGSKFSQYNLWRGTPGHQDIYESNAQDLHAYVNAMPAETRDVTGAIWATAGSPINAAMEATKDGRDLLKGPINPLNYGGGFKSIIGKMAYNYVDTIYEKLEGFSRKGTDQATVNEFVRNVNTLLSESKVPLMPVGKSIADYLGYTLSEAQEAALRSAYSATVGVAAKEVVGKNFKAFLDRSKSVTKTVNLTYGLYEAVYNASRQAMIKELGIPTKRVRVPGSPNSKPEYTNEPIHDLTVAQEAQLAKRLKDILPAMHTAMSKQEGKVENGILLAKKDRKQNNSPAYKVAVEFGSKLKNGASQLTTVGRSMVQTDPGVIAISGTTHALDSAVSHSAQEANHVLNNHDAVGAGINTLAQSAELLNKNTWSKTLNYSPLSEAHDALMRVVQGIVAMDQRGELTPEIKAAIKEKLVEIAKGTKGNNAESLVDVTAFSIFGQALQANRIKLTAMAQWAVVDQYAMDGGSYQVTAEDRQEALDKLNALPSGRAAADLQALDAFGTSLFGKGAVQATTTAPVAAAPKATVTSLFGNIGIPAIKSEDDLVTFFRSKSEATAAEVIKLLMAEGRLNSINRKILTLISRTVSPDLKIKFVTPQTSPDTVLEKPTTSARGWFIAKNGREEIYVLSPEFVDSGLTTETLLHELVHAAVARVIDNPSKEAAALVDELRSLKNEAKKYLLKNRMTGFSAALLEDRDDRKDIQEFVAWGMTDLEFQRDVLSKITMKSKTSSNRLVTGMQKFISALTGLLFKKPDANIDNGLAVLIGNVSGLFYEAAEVNNRTGSNLNLAQETVAPIDAYTTLDIHQALDNGTLEPSFQAQLGNLLTGIVDALHGPFGAFAASMRKTEAGNPLAVWLKAMETGQAPFASAIVASGFAGSAQEDFAMQQVEATVKAATDRNEALTKIAYKQLSDLYTEVKSKLKPSDFDSQEDYDFVFKLESGNGGRSDYLARFAAMGLANQKFNSMLKFATERDTRRFGEGQTFTQRLENIFEKILAFFSEKVTRTYAGQNVDEKLEALVNQLVDIEAKKRHLIKRQATETNYLAPVEEGVKKAADAARAKVGEIAGSAFVRNSGLTVVRTAGALARTVANDRVEIFLDGLQRLRDKEFKGRQGIGAGLLNDLKGPLEKFALLLRESKRREGERKRIIAQHSKQALQTFINQGKDLGKEAKAGISAVFMRTGLHNLIDTMSMADLERVISSRSELEKAITATEAQLNSRLKDRYIEQANALGYYKATGKARSSVLMLNSYLIARMSGTQFQNQVTAQEAKQVEPIIASLASLYALKYSSVQDLTQATQVLRTENNRTDGNGVEFVLKLHKQMEAESLQRLFKGNPALMVHGYTPEILNPYTAIKIADAVEGQDLLAQGYSLGAKVSQDRADPDTSGKRIYVLRDGGLAPYLTGVFSLTGLKAKGSKKHNGYMNVNTQNGLDNAVLQADITNKKLSSLQVKKDPKRDLSNDDQNHMVPIYNEMGNIVNWRYMMAEKTKNDLLERDNRFENMLGVFAGSIYDKETTQEQNLKAVTALREQFELEYATRKDSYIEVGEDSSDPEMREIWNLLPDATKQDVRKVWGRKGMKVRVDSLDLMFGYRKLSAAEFLMKDKESLEGIQKIFREWFGIYAKSRGMNEQEADNYAKKIGTMLGRGERGWQEIVREVKDIIVVKTGVIAMGNIYSNLSFLAIAGVPVKEGLKHHLVAMKAATSYQQDRERLAQLENLLAVGYSQNNDKEIREEMVRLRDSLSRNPVRELIEAGLMPTIVEDVAADEDIYSHKSRLARKTERFTNRLNPNVKAVGKFVYMSRDTKMYQSLSRITQLSDFVARYTLYQHLTSRKDNPLSKADAIQEASDAFVNYDNPMHRGMQYTDDMGFTPFMKYFLRIQRVLLKLTRENPARMLTTIALNSYMDLGPIVLDSSFTSNIGDNPFRAGAFQLPGALGDLATVNAGMALIK